MKIIAPGTYESLDSLPHMIISIVLYTHRLLDALYSPKMVLKINIDKIINEKKSTLYYIC